MTRKCCNDTFSTRFDDGFGWTSISGIHKPSLSIKSAIHSPTPKGPTGPKWHRTLRTLVRWFLKGFALKAFARCCLKCRSCTPPFKMQDSVANDTFSMRFDDGLGWALTGPPPTGGTNGGET